MHFSMILCLAFCLGISYSTANKCLSSHNALRNLHKDTGALEWDQGLADKAHQWATHLVNLGRMQHSYVKGEGENIYYSKSKYQAPCVDASLAWYKEIHDYNYNNPGFSGATGHFTQLVWKNSKKVGVAIASSQPDGQGYITTFIVAKYTPRGNFYIRGQQAAAFRANVLPKKNPNGKIPTRYELDPSLCKDNSGASKCAMYKKYGYCSANFIGAYCAKTCALC